MHIFTAQKQSKKLNAFQNDYMALTQDQVVLSDTLTAETLPRESLYLTELPQASQKIIYDRITAFQDNLITASCTEVIYLNSKIGFQTPRNLICSADIHYERALYKAHLEHLIELL
jgi:hypothetical protein